PGIHHFKEIELSKLFDFIDWTPFFHAWEMRGKYPDVLSHPDFGTEATKLFNEALEMLQTFASNKELKASGVVGIWPANSTEDDQIIIYSDEARTTELGRVNCMRQQLQKAAGLPNIALCDFVAPVDSGVADYVGGFAVTAGLGLDEMVARYGADHDQYHVILVKALADRLAEAFAE